MTPTQERRERIRRRRGGKHTGEGGAGNFARSFTQLGELAYAGAKVSANAVDIQSGQTLVSIDDRVALPTASVGKVLLLIEVAARLSSGALEPLTVLDKLSVEPVADSGIWKLLQAPSLPVVDLAALVGAVSDNIATNVLLAHIGLDAVRERAESLGLARTALLDVVRDERGPDDAPQVSIGAAAELTSLLTRLARGEIVDQNTSRRVLDWMTGNVDTSLVASAFGLDPLSHQGIDHGIHLINKTGAASGVRSEVGILRGPRAGVAYAVTVQFADTGLSTRLAVIETMRSYGVDLLEYVS